ncbi:MAG: superoxide dismutase [Clostridiales bacterium]|nr:superoxide dismutase [Clostridiales bacterium]
MSNNKYPYEMPTCSYDYNALEPYIDAGTMAFHYQRYLDCIDRFNNLLEPYPALQNLTLEQILSGKFRLPNSCAAEIINEGGALYNHDRFFNGLSPEKDCRQQAEGYLLELIQNTFGSFEQFKSLFTQKALSLFGSGWTMLTIDGHQHLEIVNVKNDETTIARMATPLILFDIWEHAYYLQYKNSRRDYIESLWHITNIPLL